MPISILISKIILQVLLKIKMVNSRVYNLARKKLKERMVFAPQFLMVKLFMFPIEKVLVLALHATIEKLVMKTQKYFSSTSVKDNKAQLEIKYLTHGVLLYPDQIMSTHLKWSDA